NPPLKLRLILIRIIFLTLGIGPALLLLSSHVPSTTAHTHETPEVAILHVAVLNSFVESIGSNILLSDAEHPDWWGKVIWHGRRGRSLPLELKWMTQKET